MKRFTRLFCELDRTTRTNEKVAALERYFSEAPPADAAWALHFLSGRTLLRLIPTRLLWGLIVAEAQLPEWLVAECHDAVGDWAETMALLLPDGEAGVERSLSELIEQRLLPLGHLPDNARRSLLIRTWRELGSAERLVWNKLITGEFRVGAARTLVVRALAKVARDDPAVMAHRVMGKWQPTGDDFRRLLEPDGGEVAVARPYPFYLASPLEPMLRKGSSVEELGDVREWQVEWKWDGIRAQWIRRAGEMMLWSRGEEMITETFPEIAEAGALLPDGTVLDGEVMAWRGEGPLPFASLQRRLGRKAVDEETRKAVPVAFVAYDLLEWNGGDFRQRPLAERRRRLEEIIARMEVGRRKVAMDGAPLLPGFEEETATAAAVLRVSPLVRVETWADVARVHEEARQHGVEGLMLKRAQSPYGVGRQRGDWWKWKVDPFVIDAVLIAAQRGHGRRASLFTDYTFGLWHHGELAPVAKAYSGLTDEEILEVDAFVRRNTLEKFGPLRRVAPLMVFELAFEGIQKSSRHRSGVAVRFPRINRWRHDKKAEEADTVEALVALASDSH